MINSIFAFLSLDDKPPKQNRRRRIGDNLVVKTLIAIISIIVERIISDEIETLLSKFK